MLWSLLSPLLQLAVMAMVFTRFFGRTTPHYAIYLFSGNLIFSYFNEATNQGMTALESNAHIFSKINVPKIVITVTVTTLITMVCALAVVLITRKKR